jgi:putative heme iron utilization protein
MAGTDTGADPGPAADRGRRARKLIRSRAFGVLSTLSVDVPGYPFGSITPYVLDGRGEPLILISTLAQHTRNIRADPRVCLTVWEEGAADPQAAGRLSWLGEARIVGPDREEATSRYLAYLPTASDHLRMHDFALYRIGIARGRYIGGFGAIFWVDAGELARDNPLASAETGILEHMNRDHSDSLVRTCRSVHGVEAREARMVGIDPEGFDVIADGRRLRFDLDPPVSTPQQVRAAMVRLSRAGD